MRGILLVAMLGVPLAGCASSLTSLSLPSGKSVPEWAMNADGTGDAAPAEPRARTKVARRAASSQVAASRSEPDAAPTNSAPASMLPLSREYREHEDAIEERLRKKMNICSGC